MKIAVKDTYWYGSGIKIHVLRALKAGEVLPPGVVIYKTNARALAGWELAQVRYWTSRYPRYFTCPVREEFAPDGTGTFVRLDP